MDFNRARFFDRLASWSYSAFLAMSGVFQIVRVERALHHGDQLIAVYQALIGIASLIMAALIITRRSKVGQASALGDRVIAAVGSYAVFPLGMLPLTWQPGWLLGATSVVLVLCYFWIIWALMTLRRSFSMFPEARELITHGPYALVRHPLYASYFLIYACVALPRISMWALPIMAVGIGAEFTRSRIEERVLRATFPVYERYARETPAFVPVKLIEATKAKFAPRGLAQPSAPRS